MPIIEEQDIIFDKPLTVPKEDIIFDTDEQIIPEKRRAEISTAPDLTFIESFMGFFRNKEDEKARAINAIAINENIGIPIDRAYDDQEMIFAELNKRKTTLEDFKSYTLPKLDYYDKIENIQENPAQLFPYVAGGAEFVRFKKLFDAVNRYDAGNPQERDLGLIREFVDQSTRDTTFGYKVLDVVSMMPSFMGELLTTGGIYTVGKKVTLKSIEKTLTKLLTEKGKDVLNKKLMKTGLRLTAEIGGRTAQAVVAGSTRIASGAVERMVKQFKLTKGDAGKLNVEITEEGMDLGEALMKSFSKQWVETLSEFSGGLLTRATVPVKNIMIKSGLFKSMMKANPGASVDDITKIFQKMGYHGVLEEMFEERVADVAHGVLESIGLGDQKFRIPSIEDLAVEFVSFSVPGVTKAGLTQLSKLGEAGAILPEGEEGKPKPEEIEVIQTPTKARTFDAEKHSLKDFVRIQGGIDSEHILTGEVERLKEFGKGRLIVKKGEGLDVDKMRQRAIDEGFLDEWASPDDFIKALEKDLSAETELGRVFSAQKDIGKEIELEAGRIFTEEEVEGFRTVKELEKADISNKRKIQRLKEKIDKQKEKIKQTIIKGREKLKAEKDNLKGIKESRLSEQEKKFKTKAIEKRIDEFVKRIKNLEKQNQQIDKIKEKFEAGKAKQAAITREKIERMERQGETEKLRQRIIDRFTFIAKGIREGTVKTKQQIKEVQKELTELTDASELDAKDKAKFMKRFPKILTEAQLQKALPAIEERIKQLEEASKKRQIAKKIKRKVIVGTSQTFRKEIEDIQKGIKGAMLKDFTVEDLNAALEETERLREKGEIDYQIKKLKKENEISQAIFEIGDNVTKGKGLTEKEKQVLVQSTTQEGIVEIVKKGGRYFRAVTLRMPRITRILEGKEGTAYEWFVNKVNKAVDTILINSDKRYEAMNEIKDKLNINIKNLAETRTVGGITFSVDEMLSVYVGEKNARKKLAIWYGNNISPELMEKVIDQMTPQEKALGDAMLKDYRKHQERLREAVIDIENRDMGLEENYSPMRRRDIEYKTPQKQILDELLHRAALKKGYVGKGFTIERVDVPEEFQKPITLGEYALWLQQVALQEEYINLMGLTRDLHRIADNEAFQAAVEHKLGKEYVARFSKYVSRVANPHIYKSFEGWEKFSREIRGNVVLAYLAGNVVTMGKQLPSVFLYLPEAGLNHWTASMVEFMQNPVKLVQRIKELDPQVKHRSIERELEELKNLKADTLYRKMKSNVQKYGLLGIRLLDITAISIGENAVYNRYIFEGFTHEQALRKAQQVTLDTQPQAHPKDLPEIYASNEVLNWFLQFTNQLNNIYNIATVDMPEYAKNREYLKTFYGSIAMAMVSLTIWAMTNKKLPEDEDDVLEAFTDQALNAIPIAGKTLQQKINGPDFGGEIPLTKNIGDIGKAIKQGYKGDFDDMANSLLRGVSPLVGNPYIFEKRTWNMLEEGDVFELLGKTQNKKRATRSRASGSRQSRR